MNNIIKDKLFKGFKLSVADDYLNNLNIIIPLIKEYSIANKNLSLATENNQVTPGMIHKVNGLKYDIFSNIREIGHVLGLLIYFFEDSFLDSGHRFIIRASRNEKILVNTNFENKISWFEEQRDIMKNYVNGNKGSSSTKKDQGSFPVEQDS